MWAIALAAPGSIRELGNSESAYEKEMRYSMAQLEVILNRLKNPSVLLSILSQLVTLLLLFGVQLDEELVTGVATTVCSILVTLGILSNPDSGAGYRDRMLKCEEDGRETPHVRVNGQWVCTSCGKVHS